MNIHIIRISLSAGGVTLKAVMAHLQHMDAHLNTLSDELCQVNTLVDRIAWQQAHLGGFMASPSSSPEASEDVKDDGDSDGGDADEDKDASSFSDDEMTTSQWLALCHSWQKGGEVLGMRVVMYLGGELI